MAAGMTKTQLVRHVAEGEVHAAGPEVGQLGRQHVARAGVHALHPVEGVVLPLRAAEELQRAVIQPLLEHHRVPLARAGGSETCCSFPAGA